MGSSEKLRIGFAMACCACAGAGLTIVATGLGGPALGAGAVLATTRLIKDLDNEYEKHSWD